MVNEEFTGDMVDYRPVLIRARAKGAQHLVLCLNAGGAATVGKQARAMGMKVTIFGCEHLHDTAEIEAANGSLDGVWFPTISITEEFRTRYLKEFGDTSIISAAAIHYDLAYILHDSYKKSGKEKVGSSEIVSLGERTGAVGSFALVERDGDRYFDIPLEIKSM